MISAKDKKNAEKLWRSLGHPLEYEGYFASVEELKTANFPIYVIEQKLGDFVMVPSESYHQVVNMVKLAFLLVARFQKTPDMRTLTICLLLLF